MWGGGQLRDTSIFLFVKIEEIMFAARQKKTGGGGVSLPDATCLIVMSNFEKKRGGAKPPPGADAYAIRFCIILMITYCI